MNNLKERKGKNREVGVIGLIKWEKEKYIIETEKCYKLYQMDEVQERHKQKGV